jgi:anti-sigma regulatory factor (Ser/Thr protein kinase)
MGRADGRAPSKRAGDLERRRAAALRAEATALRAEMVALLARTERLSNGLVELLLSADDRGGAAEERFTFRAGRLRSAVGLARQRLRSWLERGGVDPATTADITLAVSEACANAVEHPLRPSRHAFEVEATRTADAIELVVRDFGGWRPGRRDDLRGRGLRMIRELMDVVEIVEGENDTAIVMRRELEPAR